MNWLQKQLSKELWSPYAAGVMLGLVGITTVVFANTLLGASGGFENIAGMIGKAIAPATKVPCPDATPPGSSLASASSSTKSYPE